MPQNPPKKQIAEKGSKMLAGNAGIYGRGQLRKEKSQQVLDRELTTTF
jgi:hypothetical protein